MWPNAVVSTFLLLQLFTLWRIILDDDKIYPLSDGAERQLVGPPDWINRSAAASGAALPSSLAVRWFCIISEQLAPALLMMIVCPAAAAVKPTDSSSPPPFLLFLCMLYTQVVPWVYHQVTAPPYFCKYIPPPLFPAVNGARRVGYWQLTPQTTITTSPLTISLSPSLLFFTI